LQNGFDEYFGIPYSNDMTPVGAKGKAARAYPPLPLLEGNEVIETEPDQSQLTRRYTEKAVQFIQKNQAQPFFLYFPHTFPHIPLYASEAFLGQSQRGLYGDVVEELDWSVGRILETVDSLGLGENTLIVFTSDNGPWLVMKEEGGSAGLLRQGKGCTWEGGMREPFLARWTGVIPAGTVNPAIATTMDLLPTFFSLAGAPLPDDRVLDGRDMMPVLQDQTEKHQETVYYYFKGELFAIRHGAWKMHYQTLTPYVGESPVAHDPPLLYHLGHDPGELYNQAEAHRQ
jgi:arylsulfatase A